MKATIHLAEWERVRAAFSGTGSPNTFYLAINIGYKDEVTVIATTPQQLLALADTINQAARVWQTEHDEDRNGT